jgi:hypothetical protein
VCISNLIFIACVACKIQVQDRQEIKYVRLVFSNSIYQKSSANQLGVWHRTAARETLHFGCLAARLSVKDSLSCRRGTGSLTIYMTF